MKKLSEARVQKPTNCDGPLEWFVESIHEIEDCDIGFQRENYLGYRHATHRFQHSDVGRRITVTRQNAYNCWSFNREDV